MGKYLGVELLVHVAPLSNMAVPFCISLDEGSGSSTSSPALVSRLCCCCLNFSRSNRYVVVSSYISSLKTNDIEDLFMCSFAVLISAFSLLVSSL